MSNLPDMPKGLTPEFVTETLHSHQLLPEQSRVVAVDVSPLGEGTGMMSDVARVGLRFEGDQGSAPSSVVAKFASDNPTNREIAASYNLYEREARYFAELDPLSDALCPKAYVSIIQGDSFLILMEDMTDYEVGDQAKGATLAQTEAAIDELVKLHGAFWNKTDDLDWIPHISNSFHADNMRTLAEMGWDSMVMNFAEHLPVSIVNMKDDFLPVITAMQESRDVAPLTFVHGDYRMENLLYGTEPHHHPMVILDWQGPMQSRSLVDVALFLTQSSLTEVRREHERRLLDEYVAGLKEMGVTELGFDDVWQEYRHSVLYNWVYVTVVTGALDASDGRSVAWMTAMLQRQVAATEDLDLLELLPSYRS